jgi:archaellum biogenesis ATPase FlaH
LILIVEGEKDVEILREAGFVATTNSGGASKWLESYNEALREKNVVILPDNDDEGRKHAEKVANSLFGVAKTIRIVDLPELPAKGDVSDFLKEHTPDELQALIEKNPVLDETIRAFPIDPGRARNEFSAPLPLSQLGESKEVSWRWRGFLAVGVITLLIGLWKSGKSTFLSHLLKMFQDGDNLGGELLPCRILLISEEGGSKWIERRDNLQISDHVHVFCRPFKIRPDSKTWQRFLVYLAEIIKRDGFDLVIFDTLTQMWPVNDENDAAKVLSALTPLYRIVDAGAALFLIHHPGKTDLQEARASRGSGALPGFVDIILEMRRYEPENQDSRRRVLKAYSRFDETPGEVVLELTESGYVMVGSKSEVKQADRFAVIKGLLPEQPPGLTPDEILNNWPPDGVAKPGTRTLRYDLKAGEGQKLWETTGEGKKGDPIRYSILARFTDTTTTNVIYNNNKQELNYLPAPSGSYKAKQKTLHENDGAIEACESFPEPTRPCRLCGAVCFWQTRDGEWICGRCHPHPEKLKEEYQRQKQSMNALAN